MNAIEFLASKNIPTNGIDSTMLETIATAQGWVKPTNVETNVYKLYKAGKLTTSGNAKSLLSDKVMSLFGVTTPKDLFNVLKGKKIVVTLKSMSEVEGLRLSKRVLDGRNASETTGIKYVVSCVVNLGGTSDLPITFEIENKGSLVSKFPLQLLEATKGVPNEVMEAKIVMYDIDDNITLGLYDFALTPTVGEF